MAYISPLTRYLGGGHPAAKPKGWTTPASAPAPPPPPPPPQDIFDPLLDPSYAAAYSGITGANERAQAERGYQGHVYGQQYGYDQNGNLITSGADLNPYAQAAVLKRNYDISTRGATTSYANRGDLFSSAYGHAQAANQYNYGLSSDQLQRAAQAAYHNADLSVQNTADAGQAQLAALLGPALANFLASQRGS
jgi:hypothetical protein